MNSDQFESITPIAEGATAIVLRATRKADKRQFIAKALRSERTQSRRAVQEFRKEFEIGGALSGDGVVRPHEFIDGDEPMILFEDHGATSTQSLVADGPIDVATALAIGVDIATALEDVHRAGIIHRDVSPANIVYSARAGRARLIDFGLATRRTREAAGSHKLQGTFAYMSPEQTGRTNRRVDERSDLYSLGASLFHLVTGRPPFTAPNRLGLVHAHLARRPQEPSRLRPEVPQSLSAVLLHALKKDPDDRYQSAAGFRRDLERCAALLLEPSAESTFSPGAGDRLLELRLTESLVGREQELATLRSALEAGTGAARVVCVRGWSGIGKTRLVNELIPAVTEAGGAWVSGKHELLGRGVPYAGLSRAVEQWAIQLSAFTEEAAPMCERLRMALGPEAAALVKVIPALGALLGPLPPVAECPPMESERRLAVLFGALFGAIAPQGVPLVVFVDDLQWADNASLGVLQHLATLPESRQVVAIVAWREDEVGEGHPVLTFLHELAASGVGVQSVHLGPLSQDAVREFVGRSLQQPGAVVRPLADAVFAASSGSPFLAGRVLTDLAAEGALYSTADGWMWRLDSPILSDTRGDETGFVRRRLQSMPDDAQRALAVGAWLGSRFSLVDVASALAAPIGEVAKQLSVAMGIEVIRRVDDSPVEFGELTSEVDASLLPTWQFVHDRVQQAASELVPAGDRAALRLALARLLRDQEGDRRFEAVDHALAAGEALTESTERMEFARLAGAAGRAALQAASFDVASRALEAALGWGLAELSVHSPDEAAELVLTAAEAAYLNTDRTTMERHVALLLERFPDALIRIRAEEIAVAALMAAGDLGACLDRGISALRQAGLALPPQPGLPHVLAGLLRTKFALRRFSPADLASLPLCTDALARARARLLNELNAPAWYGRPLLFPLIAFSMMREAVAYGCSPETAPSMIVFAIVNCAMGSIDNGLALGNAALVLNERLLDRRLRNRTTHLWNAHIRFWTERWHVCRDDLSVVHRGCWEGGDIEYAAFSAFMSVSLGIHTGEALDGLHDRSTRTIAAIRALGQRTMLHTTLLHHQLILNLMGHGADPHQLKGADYDETEMETLHRSKNDKVNRHCLGVARAMLSCFLGDFERAAGAMVAVDDCDQDAKSQPLHHMGTFYDALAHAALGRRGRARKKLKALLTFAKYGPVNFSHRVALVEAELAGSRGAADAAILAWERAAALAGTHGYPHERALALWRAARFQGERGNAVAARAYAAEARAGFVRWGAQVLVDRLDSELAGHSATPGVSAGALGEPAGHGALGSTPPSGASDASPRRPSSDWSASTTGSVGGGSDHPLDLEGLLAAARRISVEFDVARVTTALLESVLVLAGATHATLSRVEGTAFRRVLHARSEGEGIAVSEPDPTPQPSPLLEDVARAGQPLSIEGRDYASDWSSEGRAPRSVLLVPVLHAGRALGVLTLEHDLLVDAFPPRRVAPIEALAAQAGIAFENAVHYEELDSRVRDRTRELLAARREADLERDRADELLMNVLPESIALELKHSGRAAPVSVAAATVLFTDFAGFTELSAQMTPEALVAELERCFAAFDDIVDRYGVTKLKTIGDAYMAVAGIPTSTETHAYDAVRAGVDMAAWVTQPTDGGPPVPFRIRIGLNTGPLVAGVIGKRRFLYDVWGDAVNTASRMESSGVEGRVNLSRRTWELVSERVACTPRGLVSAKGKGELEMFLVDRILS